MVQFGSGFLICKPSIKKSGAEHHSPHFLPTPSIKTGQLLYSPPAVIVSAGYNKRDKLVRQIIKT